jgi:thioredoxin 1
MIQEIKSTEEFQTIIERGVTVVDFFADWCGPCKRIAPDLERISNVYTMVKFVKVDVDAFEDLCRQYNVSAMPTFILFKGGVEEKRFLGGSHSTIEKIQSELDAI